MSWIREANKIGRYERSYRGFRIYCTKEPEIKTGYFEKDGEQWRQTDFIKGDLVAIDKHGVRFEENYVENLAFKIDIELYARKFND